MIKMLPIFILLFTFWFLVPGTNAQEACRPNPTNPNAKDGLISAPSISGFTSNLGVCNQDPSSAFAPYKIPTYDDLKSLYYTQSKSDKKVDINGDNLTSIADQTVYQTLNNGNNGDLSTGGNLTDTGTAVIFVDGNLSISSNFTYGSANSGLVFVVKKNVYISQTVSRVDAVIISSGTIYTALLPTDTGIICNHKKPYQASAGKLVINGSLVSLNENKPIEFCRTLADNTQPAELINHQVKYLVILRNLLSDTLQRWSEIQ